ncbi:MAG: FAD-dependent oxidoreductase [Candidatus Baltobacteraceae bacterium]
MITAESLTHIPIFASAHKGDLDTIVSRSADMRVSDGDWLVLEGEAPAFLVVLEGRFEIVKMIAGAERVLGTLGVGEFFGEGALLLGSGFLAGLRAAETSRAMRLDPLDFHDLVVKCPTVNRAIIAAMASQIAKLEEVSIATPVAAVAIVGHHWDFECYDVRDFLARNHVGFRWIDPDDPSAPEYASVPVEVMRGGRYPVVIFSDRSYLVKPSFRSLAERLGLQTCPRETIYDVAIVGAGPAGLAAAVYGASEGLRTVLVESRAPGGQAGTSSRIENYLGFPAGISGDDLGSRALAQARRLGAEILVTREAKAIEPRRPDAPTHTLVLDGADRIETKSIVIATGVTWRRLSAPGADALLGRGVYYGAAQTEALGARGKDVFLVGGGNSAGQAAMLFSNYARSVTILVRGEKLAASMSQYLVSELATKANVRIEVECEIVNVVGGSHIESIDVKYRNGEQKNLSADEMFVFIGAQAETGWLPSELIRDAQGFICTGRDVVDLQAAKSPGTRGPYLLESSISGIFAVGDVRHGSMKRVASSVGEGSMAIALVHQYLSELQVLATTA